MGTASCFDPRNQRSRIFNVDCSHTEPRREGHQRQVRGPGMAVTDPPWRAKQKGWKRRFGDGLFGLLNRLFHGPPWLTFLIMGMAAGGLALCSFNLLFLFQANYNLLFTYGAMAAFDGGLLQFLELAAWGYVALACYVVVEGCLEGLLGRVRRARL